MSVHKEVHMPVTLLGDKHKIRIKIAPFLGAQSRESSYLVSIVIIKYSLTIDSRINYGSYHFYLKCTLGSHG